MDAQLLRRRFARALAVCTVVFVVVAMLLLRMEDSGAPDQADAACEDSNLGDGSTYVSRVWQGMNSGKSVEDALADTGFMVFVRGSNDFPQWFESEVFEIAEGERLVLDPSGATANIVLSGGVDEALPTVDAALRQNGWLKIDVSEQGTGSSEIPAPGEQIAYQKKGGICRWLMLTPIEVEDGTSVTMHIQRA